MSPDKQVLISLKHVFRNLMHLRKRWQQPFSNNSRKKEFSVFLVCLLVAASIWMLIKLSQDYSAGINVELRWQDLPENLYPLHEPDEHVYAILHGTGFSLFEEKYLSSRPVARLSIKRGRLTRGDGKMEYTIDMNSVSDDLLRQCGFESRVTGFSPGVVHAVYARYDTVMKPVRPVFVDRKGDTLFALEGYSVHCPEMPIRGIVSELSVIEALGSDPVHLDSVELPGSFRLRLRTPVSGNTLSLLDETVICNVVPVATDSTEKRKPGITPPE